ncbi:MAG: YqgE/AlgH family protein [Verrucomicrobia bacterium]|nr:YqgE/AlgH family protein [Verrucomicrobiota bacterium]
MGKHPASLKAQFLLDGGSSQASCFNRTVVLICQHDSTGAFGLVLNRPTEALIKHALPGSIPAALQDFTLFDGGPVQPQALSFLWSDPVQPEANVLPNLSLGHELDELMDLAADGLVTRKLKVFAGYAGWSPGQLEDEMKRKAWITHPASLDWVFNHSDSSRLWADIISKKGWQYKLMASGPEDPSVN